MSDNVFRIIVVVLLALLLIGVIVDVVLEFKQLGQGNRSNRNGPRDYRQNFGGGGNDRFQQDGRGNGPGNQNDRDRGPGSNQGSFLAPAAFAI
jgi:hypothetical protein